MPQLPTVSREELRQRRQQAQQSPEYRVPFARNAITDAIAREGVVRQLLGQEPVEQDLQEHMERYVGQRQAPRVARDTGISIAINRGMEQQAEALQARKEEVKWTDQVGAAWNLITGTQAIIDWAGRERYERDPNFNYWDHQKEIEEGLTYEENRWIRNNAVSLESARALREEAMERREQEFVLGARGAVPALTASLVGGVADPVGWAAGLGVGKALHLAGAGSRALYLSGQTGRAVGVMAAESAAANVAIEGILEAAGRRVDAQDYAIAAGFGGAFGVALSPVAFRGMNKEAAEQAFRDIQNMAREQQAQLYTTAATNLGPNATPDAISREVLRLQQAEGRWLDEVRLAMPDEADRFMPTTAGEVPASPDAPRPLGEGPDAQLRVEEDAAALRAAQRREDAALRAAEDARAEAVETARLRLSEDTQAVEAARARGDADAELRALEDMAESEALYRQAIRDTESGRVEGAPGTQQDDTLRAAEDLAESQRAARVAEGEEPELVPDPTGQQRTPADLPSGRQPTDYDREIGADGLYATDPIRAQLVSDVHARADAWAARNPVDESRLRDLLTRVGRLTPRLATTAQQLLRSNHPVARMVAGVLLENTTGAAGRRATAALDKAMFERVYLGELEKVPDMYRAWRQQQGGSALRDWFNSNQVQEFNRLVSEYRVRRMMGQDDPDVNPFVKQASEFYDRFYALTARDQKRVGTPGSEGLPVSSVGYFPRRLKASFVQNLTNAQRRALTAEYRRQLRILWDDSDLADRVAAQIVDRARIQAAGGVEIPAHVYSNTATGMIRDSLTNIRNAQGQALTPEEIERALRKISNRSPAHTKERLDLDVLSEIVDPDTGESFRLMDVYETDQLKLALNYGRRTSGEVALSKYGVPGEEGLEVLRDALTIGRDGQRLTGQALDDALLAYDQIAAEFLGRGFQTHKWTNGLDNLRMLTASSRLGGMAFTQFGEYANAIPALGVTHALAAVKAFPRLIADVRAGRSDPILQSVERVGGEIGTDWKTNFPFQNMDDTFVHGQESMTAFDRVVRATSNAIPHLNGWHYVHAAQVRGMAQQIIHKATRMIREGVSEGEQLRMMEDMGFSPELRAAWRADLDRVAKFDSKGNLVEFDVTGFRDPKVAHDIVQAINRGSKQIIQGSYIGEKGLWAHEGFLRVLTQFRTFSLVSVEKQWTRVSAIRGGIKTFGFLLGAMSFAIPIHLARIQINSMGRSDRDEYIEQQLDVMNFTRAVMNYASLSGFASDMLDVGAALVTMTEGMTGLESGMDFSGVRGVTDGDLGAIIPGLGYANSTFRALAKGQPENLLRSLPGGNIPWAVPLINAITAKEADSNWDFSDH